MIATLPSRASQSLLRRQRPLLPEFSRASSSLLPKRYTCKFCSIPFPPSHRAIHTKRRSLSVSLRRTGLLPRSPSIPRVSSTPSIPSSFGNRPFATTAPSRREDNMASTSDPDQDYMAFLNKANEDPAKGQKGQTATATAGKNNNNNNKKGFRTRQEGVEVPAPLLKVCGSGDAFYVSEADEPFEAVALGWDEAGRGLPDEEEFAGLIEHWDPKNAEVEIMDPVDWDRNGQYQEVVDAVREAGEGNDVRVYRVARDGVRSEYWVVTTEGKGKGARLVGAKALAVES